MQQESWATPFLSSIALMEYFASVRAAVLHAAVYKKPAIFVIY